MATIAISDFQKVEMRVGKIVDVADFPEARNPSYRLRIDFGPLGIKTSSAAVQRWYTKADLLGRSVVAVTNFPAPRSAPSCLRSCVRRGAPRRDRSARLPLGQGPRRRGGGCRRPGRGI